jgi:hypothetical protein
MPAVQSNVTVLLVKTELGVGVVNTPCSADELNAVYVYALGVQVPLTSVYRVT